MAGRLEGEVVFITGVARGQGRAHAIRFAEEGADVIGVDICADIPHTGYPLSTRADLDETVAMVEQLDRRITSPTPTPRTISRWSTRSTSLPSKPPTSPTRCCSCAPMRGAT